MGTVTINILKVKYPFIKTETIGKSVQGRDLVAVRLGNGPKEVFYSASIHAQEWITVPLLMKFIEEYSRAYVNGSHFLGHDPRTMFNQTTIYILPICNPDGVELVLRGISKDDPKYNTVMELNNWNSDFSGWRANINGVDLNLQFPANWDKLIKKKTPSYADYPGPEPLSEPESKSMYDFTLAHDFKLVLSFHSQGQVIFWRYYGMEPPGTSNIVQRMSDISGYTPYDPARTYGGYRDWFIQQYRRPGFTIEVGKGENPLPVSQFADIWRKTAPLMLYTASI